MHRMESCIECDMQVHLNTISGFNMTIVDYFKICSVYIRKRE